MMALRAHQENCTILLGARLNSHYFSLLFNSSILLSSSLSPITDIHLVLDYFSDQFWGSLKPARSNRFYLNMDEDNNQLVEMQGMAEKEREFRSQVFVLGGVQLVDWGRGQGQSKGKEVMGKLRQELNEVKQWSKVHIEMGNFANKQVI